MSKVGSTIYVVLLIMVLTTAIIACSAFILP